MKENIYNFARQHERMIIRIKESGEISEENKKKILDFDNSLFIRELSPSRILSYLHYAVKYAKMIRKPFLEVTNEEILEIVAQLNRTDLSDYSKKGFKVTLKSLYKFLEGIVDVGVCPERLRGFKTTIPRNHQQFAEGLFTDEEILTIIQKCDNLRDKTIMALLAESGCRVSEIALLKIKNVSFEKYGARLNVNGKTGGRVVLVVTSSLYLQNYINQHPFNDDPESYLWYNPNKKPLCHARFLAILKKAAKLAGIKRRVYLYLFRHSRCTLLAKKMSDSQLKQYCGWLPGSNMASVYIHLSGKDTDEAILEMNGIKTKEQEIKSELEPKKCLRCNTLNEPTSVYCGKCYLHLNKEEADRIIKSDIQRQAMDEIMEKLIAIPRVKDVLLEEAQKLKGNQ